MKVYNGEPFTYVSFTRRITKFERVSSIRPSVANRVFANRRGSIPCRRQSILGWSTIQIKSSTSEIKWKNCWFLIPWKRASLCDRNGVRRVWECRPESDWFWCKPLDLYEPIRLACDWLRCWSRCQCSQTVVPTTEKKKSWMNTQFSHEWTTIPTEKKKESLTIGNSLFLCPENRKKRRREEIEIYIYIFVLLNSYWAVVERGANRNPCQRGYK